MKFIPGLQLNQQFYSEVVRPLLYQFDPDLIHSAALMGYGSDVLGFDNATSMDHNWGPRGQIFVGQTDAARIDSIRHYLAKNLPPEFMGFPTHFSGKGPDGTQHMQLWEAGEINHLVEVYEIDAFFHEVFHKDVTQLSSLDWLCVSEQKLVEMTRGRVFHDGLQKLEKFRSLLRYYPHEVKLLKLAAYWDCISNGEAFVGRAVEFGDLLGAKMIAARMVNYLLKICFVLKGQYAPYSKWFTRQLDQLNLGVVKSAAVEVLTENEPDKIEARLAELYLKIIDLQNQTPGLPRVEKEISNYYRRPYKVIMANEIVNVLRNAVTNEQLKQLDLRIVGIDGKIDSNDFTDLPHLERLIRMQ